ncbi:hypothetical protein BO86DRAFT_379405 [Aspergillus japonicus CBS 114.51]|uniref:Alpha/beta hydrolase domain-containing protein n=2 Tax=Aspergillus TaxID=5052 RepID=A0A2V5IKK0_ASPV1|nr:hypothetical protein BO86DRAFT_379405 [Aspergillus japonicus CBS 114.51]PYI24407.1 hypothetical protein BO99DRAFT_398449 [Aspergillus violaceofuscus CBS 115571]RAH81581.1 hypothetical protein BO86DRAFT_379405 [Aspergillus japonicus CBS 114.51]
MTDEESPISPKTFAIPEPTVTFVPETDPSHPTILLEPYHVDLLPEYDFISQEYLISGTAQGQSYCTRLLLRRPADPARFSGFVVAEPSHLWGGTSIWRHVNRWVMRNDHAWLEVDSQAPSATEKIKNVDPDRYAAINSMAAYRRRAGTAIARQMKSGFLLPEDAEVLRRETVERVHFS